MFLRLYNFIRGHLVVKVTGFSVVRFINLSVRRGVYLWDVRESEEAALFRVSIKGFKLLRYCSRKSGCKLKITKKVGLPFILYRYRSRKALLFGVVLFIGIIVYLTSFIWLVTITGNSNIESAALANKLTELGVTAGGYKRGLNVREIEENLMAAFPDIAFANVKIKGTHVRLDITEIIEKKEFIDRSKPSDIIAVKDGLIMTAATESGRPLVRPGDVVQAGDVLVSGELKVGNDSIGFHSYYVRSMSKVTAKRYYEYVFDVPLIYEVKSFTGNMKRNYGIILFKQKIYLENSPSPFESYDIKTEEHRLNFGADYPLPASYFTETFREFIPTQTRRSVEEAEIMGQTIIMSRLMREAPEDFAVLETEISYEEKDGALTVTARVAVQESIGEERPMATPPPQEQEIDNQE